ncbi:GTPase HflX [Candidatus Dependentiae bacterium]|nr:GTPase HflX [Candidatus Dependentiae bacterium]
MAKGELIVTADQYPATLLVGIFGPNNRMRNSEDYFDEFVSLVETLETPYDETYFTKLRYADSNMFLTKGKLEELVQFCEGKNFEQIIFSEILTPLQERNLEDALGCIVIDREHLILDIFSKAAKTAEGKIQVEMATIEFMRTRIAGKGKEFAQQAGFIGTRGPGETYKEEIKRHFADKFRQAKKKLDVLHNARAIQRKQRLENKIPLISIIGYTNAGKSSLLNRLTKSDVLAENKLFATLDTTTRELYIDHTKKYLISDTVGFISNLPHNLIEAFKSTLDELAYANLLLHVIDLSNPSWEDQIEVVNETLQDLHVGDKSIVYVFNKIDRLSDEEIESLRERIQRYTPAVLVHTMTKEGVAPLLEVIKKTTL